MYHGKGCKIMGLGVVNKTRIIGVIWAFGGIFHFEICNAASLIWILIPHIHTTLP